MPRIAIPINRLAGTRGNARKNITLVTGDAVEGHYWELQEGDVLVAFNTAGGTRHVRVHHSNDYQGRPGSDAVYSEEAVSGAQFHALGPFTADGWVQRGPGDEGKVFVDTPLAGLQFAILRGA